MNVTDSQVKLTNKKKYFLKTTWNISNKFKPTEQKKSQLPTKNNKCSWVAVPISRKIPYYVKSSWSLLKFLFNRLTFFLNIFIKNKTFFFHPTSIIFLFFLLGCWYNFVTAWEIKAGVHTRRFLCISESAKKNNLEKDEIKKYKKKNKERDRTQTVLF